MALKKLKDKHVTFCKLILSKVTPEQSAIRCGFSPASARIAGWKLLKEPLIKAYLEEHKNSGLAPLVVPEKKKPVSKALVNKKYDHIVQDAQTALKFKNIEVSRKRLINELYVISTLDPALMFADDGSILPIQNMPPEIRHAIGDFRVTTKTAKNGDVYVETVVKFQPKIQAILAILQNTEIQKDKIEEMTPIDRMDEIKRLQKEISIYGE